MSASTGSEGIQYFIPPMNSGENNNKFRPVSECAVTIEPPSDSSTPLSPGNSPVRTVPIPRPHSLPQSPSKEVLPPSRKKVIFLPKDRKISLGASGREARSLDVIPKTESPVLTPILRDRKLSKSLDHTDDLNQILLQGMEELTENREHGVFSEDEEPQTEQELNRKNYHQAYDDTSSLDEKGESSHLLERFNDKENEPINYGPNPHSYRAHAHHEDDLADIESFDEDDDEVDVEEEVSHTPDPSLSKPKTKVPNMKKKKMNREKLGYNSGKGGDKEKRSTSVKKWFQNILNGNGITGTGSPGSTSNHHPGNNSNTVGSTPNNSFPTINSNPFVPEVRLSDESQDKLLTSGNKCGRQVILESESIV